MVKHDALWADQIECRISNIECRILNVEVKMHDPDIQINSFVMYFDIRHSTFDIYQEQFPQTLRRFTADFPIHI